MASEKPFSDRRLLDSVSPVVADLARFQHEISCHLGRDGKFWIIDLFKEKYIEVKAAGFDLSKFPELCAEVALRCEECRSGVPGSGRRADETAAVPEYTRYANLAELQARKRSGK